MQSRRQFILSCSVTAAGASLAPVGVFAADRWRLDRPLELVTFQHFAGQLNTPFTVRTSSGTVRLHLAEVDRTPVPAVRAEDSNNEKFSLLFLGPAARPLDQDTYQFEHPGIGRFSMFIVPIVCLDTSHCYYEAVFNHPSNPADFAAQISRAPAPAWKR